MNFHDPALTFAIALAAGVLAQSVALHLRVPGIILLLATGVLLGPEFASLVIPDTLGDGLHHIVGLSIAVVLFEGGLNLNVRRVRRQALTIRQLITTGAAITAVGGMLASLVFVGWDSRVALLFGALVIVTGPTVINPIMRRIRVTPRLRTILEAEGILIDPIGAIVAVVALEVILQTTARGAATGLLGLPSRLAFGALLGISGGFLTGFLLRFRNVVPLGYENIFTLASVLALFEISDAFLAESGIMAVAIAGLVVGNMRTRVARELVEFKEQLTILLVGLLFVLLAADVSLADVRALGWRGFGTVLTLILLVRPLNILACTRGSDLDLRGRAFLAWMAPRGIVAFAISSLFAERLEAAGMAAEGAQLSALVFLVIGTTVVLQGGTAGLVARILRVRRASGQGHAIVGANALGRALASGLREAGGRDESIVLIDTNPNEAQAAEAQGFRVVLGNASAESTLLKAGIDARRSFSTLTPNEGVNLLLATKAMEYYRIERTNVALDAKDTGVVPKQVHEAGARVLFGKGIDHERWSHEFLHGGAEMSRWHYSSSGAVTLVAPKDVEGPIQLLALVHTRGRRPNPADDQTSLKKGDEVTFAWTRSDEHRARAWLQANGWRAASRS
jgi:NhaP-type Na+/H+ or K+/H+ antiporter